MDRPLNHEKIQPPPAYKLHHSWHIALEQIMLGLVIVLSPVLATTLTAWFISMLFLNPASIQGISTLTLPAPSWVFWIGLGTSLVIVLTNAFNKSWTLVTKSLLFLLVLLIFLQMVTSLLQAWLQQLSPTPTRILMQQGQMITDDATGLSLTYLSAYKITKTNDGQVYVIAHVRLTNASSNPAIFIDPTSLFVWNANKGSNSNEYSIFDPSSMVPGYHGNSLYAAKNNPVDPGTTVEGDVAFSCFPNEIPDQFGWDPNFGSDHPETRKIYVGKLIFQ